MDDLSRLFGAYRDAIPDPEPSADFMPGLWKRIDSRRSSVLLLRRFTQAFVTLAAVVTVLVGVVLIPYVQALPVYSATYIDVLAEAQSNNDAMAYTEGSHVESQPDSPTR